MTVYSLQEIVSVARKNSPFYKKLYSSLPRDEYQLHDIPIVDQKEFWIANTIQDNQVLTGPMSDGIVFKSGGTTGSPKFSVYNKEEWAAFTTTFGRGMVAGGLKSGERVANIFYGGELYASFLFITKSMEMASKGVLQFPIMGLTSLPVMAAIIREYDIDVIAGLPTSIVELAEFIEKDMHGSLRVKRILYGGESMYPDQMEKLAKVFPGVKISSIGYASVDAGALGYADETCGPNEHRVFGKESILEIVDEETQEVITEQNRPGKVIFTNLTRLLMPIIRYPAGDRAIWMEPPYVPDRKFCILGRSEDGARVGPMTIYVEDMRKILNKFSKRLGISEFQMVVLHKELRDQLVLRIVGSEPESILRDATQDIIAEVYRQRPMFQELHDDKKILPLAVDWIKARQLITNPRSGKLEMIVDQRSE